MADGNLQISIVVRKTPQEVFDAINNVTGWWTQNLTGDTRQLNDEFEVRFGDVHHSKQRLIELEPNKKIVWLVTESDLSFVKQRTEWTGTMISFEIIANNKHTEVCFRHLGLTKEIECYNACSNAWVEYINGSLKTFIEEGKVQPVRN
ncbi:MAG: SRPBCC domain-containing protein [Chitinophagaceae bacterium]|nr:SRPBCC domain-containing protein [Chitinophagaceae bacterium]